MDFVKDAKNFMFDILEKQIITQAKFNVEVIKNAKIFKNPDKFVVFNFSVDGTKLLKVENNKIIGNTESQIYSVNMSNNYVPQNIENFITKNSTKIAIKTNVFKPATKKEIISEINTPKQYGTKFSNEATLFDDFFIDTEPLDNKVSNGANFKQVMMLTPELAPWYKEVMNSMKDWKQFTSGKSWVDFNTGFKTLGSILDSVKNNVNSISKVIDLKSGIFKQFLQVYKKESIKNYGNPKNDRIEVSKSGKVESKEKNYGAKKEYKSSKDNVKTENIKNYPLRKLFASLKEGLITDNCFDILIERLDSKNEDTLSEKETQMFAVRAEGIEIPGKIKETKNLKWHNGLELTKGCGKIKSEKIQRLSFDLDSKWFILEKLLSFSGMDVNYRILSDSEVEDNYVTFENFIKPQEYKYNIKVYIYDELNPITVPNKNSSCKNIMAMYVFEDVKFLGLNKVFEMSVKGGDAVKIGTEFTYLRGYFVDNKALDAEKF